MADKTADKGPSINDLPELESIVESAGYGLFNPLNTRLMNIPHLYQSGHKFELDYLLENNEVIDYFRIGRFADPNEQVPFFELNSYFYYLAARSHLIARSIKPLDKVKVIEYLARSENYTYNATPREDWNSRFKNLLTGFKETEEGLFFVDCWQETHPKSKKTKGALKLIAGKMQLPFSEKYSEETLKVLMLYELRRHYDYVSIPGIIIGPTLSFGLVKRIFEISCSIVAYNSLQTGKLVPLFEMLSALAIYAGVDMALYQTHGKGFFKRNNLKIGREAMNYLQE